MRRLAWLDTPNGRWRIPYADAETPARQRDYRGIILEPHRMHGGFDIYGLAMPPKGPFNFKHTFKITGKCEEDVNYKVAHMLKVLDGGRGRLWQMDYDLSSNRRWTYAKAKSLTPLPWKPKFVRHAENEVEFFGEDPHWYANLVTGDHPVMATVDSDDFPAQGEDIEEYLFAQETITSSPHTFDVENKGDATCYRCLFRLESLAADGFVNPRLENITAGLPYEIDGVEWSSTRDGANSSHILQVNTWVPQVNLSTDGGSSWANDYPLFTHQRHFWFALAPGVNTLRFTSGGTVNCRLRILHYHSFLS